MKKKSQLDYDPALEIPRPYFGDSAGAFVLDDSEDSIQMALLKSEKHHELLAKVWFGPRTAGPPGHVHGGCQAAVLDEMMGSTCWYWKYKVVAGTIEIKFTDMIPLLHSYSVRGQITRIEGRKIFVEAEIHNGGKTYAKSQGIFIELKDEQLGQLKIARERG
jgi:acyl-coenzyme A thioesterase PaaI-like protein